MKLWSVACVSCGRRTLQLLYNSLLLLQHGLLLWGQLLMLQCGCHSLLLQQDQLFLLQLLKKQRLISALKMR